MVRGLCLWISYSQVTPCHTQRKVWLPGLPQQSFSALFGEKDMVQDADWSELIGSH